MSQEQKQDAQYTEALAAELALRLLRARLAGQVV